MHTSSDRTIVLCNMSFEYDWDKGLVNRNYHMRNQLLVSGRFYRVISVDFIPFTWKKKIKYLLRERPWKRTSLTIEKGLTWQIRKSAEHESLSIVHTISVGQLHKLLQKLNVTDTPQTTLWIYNPFTSPLLEKYPSAIKIVDAVDNWMEHSAYAHWKETLQEHYHRITQFADTIFTVSQALVEYFKKNPYVWYVPNGVDVTHFQNAQCTYDRMKNIKGPVVGYHGNIQGRINFRLLKYLIQKHAEYQFVFAGFVWKDVRYEINELKKFPNVHVFEGISYTELPTLIACFDVAIIPHVIDQFTQSMNPLKMYEYIAAGKPIISTAVAGAEQLGDLIQLAVSPEDFSRLIEEQLNADSAEQMERRMMAAESHSWESRFTLMQERLDEIEVAKNEKSE